MKTPSLRMYGSATVELIVTLLALAPFLVGIPLLGKQLDIKHKAYDATRYSAWERTVWSNAGPRNRKSDEEISLESRDRALGDPRSGLISTLAVREQGVGENPLWRDSGNRRMVRSQDGADGIRFALEEQQSPVDVGYWFVPGIAHGQGPIERVAETLQVRNLNLNRYGFATASTSIAIRPLLSRAAQRSPSLDPAVEGESVARPLVQQAAAAILSDTWSALDENSMRRRIDDVTTNELIEELERPARAIGMQARGKGEPLYGEGQYGWGLDLRPRSTTLPAAYIRRR